MKHIAIKILVKFLEKLAWENRNLFWLQNFCICSVRVDWASDYCLTLNEQFCNYICISRQEQDTFDEVIIMSALYWNNSWLRWIFIVHGSNE